MTTDSGGVSGTGLRPSGSGRAGRQGDDGGFRGGLQGPGETAGEGGGLSGHAVDLGGGEVITHGTREEVEDVVTADGQGLDLLQLAVAVIGQSRLFGVRLQDLDPAGGPVETRPQVPAPGVEERGNLAALGLRPLRDDGTGLRVRAAAG
ncbi:hypothetical protein ABZ341_33565 [Streptomyces sp. NPDC006173]|uniref:hypothetical protein n=1 Tax=Streptomyces sp. NPDC006173 TaxID=3155349 RepID=UPI003401FB94